METKPESRAPGGRSVTGESAIIVPVRVPVGVTRLRDRMDPSASEGVPAHVTLLYPFMPVERLTDAVRATIAAIVASEPSFPLVFNAVRRWPDVVYLEPGPADPFRRMTAALVRAFPDFPPYEGAHEEVIPHLTVAQGVPEDHFAAAEHALPAMLPIRDVVREAWLIGHTPDQPWHTLWRLPLGEARPSSSGVAGTPATRD